MPTLTVGGYRLPYTPRSVSVPCPCGEGTIRHHYARFAGGAHEPPSEEYLHSTPCDSCDCDNETSCPRA